MIPARLKKVFLILLLVSGGCYKNEPVPVADFTMRSDNDYKIPCTVTFTNTSVNSFSWEWNFGDDSLSTLKSPVHLYPRPGKYTITMRAYTESRREWASVLKVLTIKDTVQ